MKSRQRMPMLLLILLPLLTLEVMAQASIPQRIMWQGIARDESGAVISNQSMTVRFSILDGSALGNTVYIERHQAATNEFGLFTLHIGGGTPDLGNFSQIDWGSNVKYLRVELDVSREGEYVNLGTSQLVSVPYALAAGKPRDLRISDLVDVSSTTPQNGSTLVFNGEEWVPGPGPGTSGISTNETLTGAGTEASPLGLARQGATFRQVLKWDGGGWRPADDEGEDFTAGRAIEISNGEIRHGDHTGDVTGSAQLTVTGLRGQPLVPLLPGDGQVLKYFVGEGWMPAPDNSQAFFPGNGISINGNLISNSVWQVSGSNIFRTSGNVGIGTGNPQQQLHVGGAIQFGGALMPQGKAGLDGQILVSDGPGKVPVWTNPRDAIGGNYWSTTGNADINVGVNFLGTTDANPLLLKTNGTERIRVTATGNVGIGETTPGTALEVGGGDVYVNNSANGVVLRSPNGSCWRITVDNSGNLTTTAIACP